jgi:oligosaccharide repeat unit polymerase
MWFLLITIEVFIIILNFKVFKWEICSLSTISSIVFFIATLFALYCKDIWQIHLSNITVLVITIGLLTMTFAEKVGRKIRLKTNTYTNGNISQVTIVSINKQATKMLCIIVIICTILYGIEAYKIGIANGGSGLNAFAYMKLGYINGTNRMNTIIRQGYKVVYAGSILSCFFLLYNTIVSGQKLINNFEHVMVILCGMLITIFSGSRTEIFRIISALLMDFAVISHIYHGTKKKDNIRTAKYLLRLAISLAIIVILFGFGSRTIVKPKYVTVSDTNSVIYYVAYYVGSPIAVLNKKIELAESFDAIFFGQNDYVLGGQIYLGGLNYGGNVGTILCEALLGNGIFYMVAYIFFIYFIGGMVYAKINSMKKFTIRNIIFITVVSSWYYVFTISYYSDVMSLLGNIILNFYYSLVIIIMACIIFRVRLRCNRLSI